MSMQTTNSIFGVLKITVGLTGRICASSFLPLLLLLTLPAVVQAQDYIYTTDNGTITITQYTGTGGAVIIPDTINGLPVTTIGGYWAYHGGWYGAFKSCALTSVTIPDSVTSIGDRAFDGCTNLTSVTIPNSVTSIGSSAFANCTSLNAITVNALNVVYSSVDGVLFNESQTTLVEYPGGMAGSYTIPNSVSSIADYAFCGCYGLTSIIIPDSVTSIADYAFQSCCSLTNITIGSSVTRLGEGTFYGCASLTNVTIPNSVTSIGDGAFYDCSGLTTVTIGNGVTSIGISAFCDCTRLSNIIIPDSVTSIGISAFSWCVSLASVTIPNGVTDIGYGAFGWCTSLTSVTIGNSVTSIGDGAFDYCTSLIAFTVDTNNPTYSSVGGVLFNSTQTTLIQYPEGKAGGYTIPNSVTSIGGGAFFYCTSLTSVTIPNSVTSLGYAAFLGCTSLTALYFKGNAPSVATYAFDGDTNTVYYLPGTTGWSGTFGGRPTALWVLPYPVILNTAPSLGVQTNSFGFIISWATNIPVVVEASTTLANPTWSPVGTIPLTGGSAYFSDPDWTNYPARFYRIRSP
jgi:hypothetical protein